MIESDFFKLLEEISSVFPNFLPKDQVKKNSLANIWWKVLKDCSYKVCYENFVDYAKDNQYPPKPQDIYFEPKEKNTQLEINKRMFEEWEANAGPLENIEKLVPENFKRIAFSSEDKAKRLSMLREQVKELKA